MTAGIKPPFGAGDRFPDVRFRPGEISVLIGGDGAGKSAMLRLLAEPAEGMSPKDVGFQPSSSGTWPQLTVRENLDFVAGVHHLEQAAARERADELIRAAGLDGAEGRLARNLSGGMRQKLGVIMAMLPSPALLILDEPTTGVDVDARARLWELMALAAEEGAIVLASTTYLDEAENAAQVVFLDHGEVIAAGTPERVIAAAPGQVHQLLYDGPAHTPSVPGSADGGMEWRRGRSRYRWLPGEGERRGSRDHEASDAVFSDTGVSDGGGPGTARTDAVPAEMDLELATIAYLLDREDAGDDGEVDRGHGEGGGEGDEIAERVTVRDAGDLLVEADGATKRYGSFTALDDVSMEVCSGEIVGLIGGNGAGKTTLMRIMLGLERATEGTVTLLGGDPGPAARRDLGYVPQSLGLYPTLTARENLDFTAGIFGADVAPELHAAADRHGKRLVGDLPLGAQRDLAVVCAIAHDPRLLVLDEPTSGMDALSRARFWARLRALAERGTGVLITTHYAHEAIQCDRIVELEAGRVVDHGA